MMKYENVSILIAVRNEAENISRCLSRVFSVCPGAEVLVIDGGTDGTGVIVKELTKIYPTLKYIYNENDAGKGHATRVGIAHASRPVIAQVDADMQFPPEQLPLILEPIIQGDVDVTLGSRFASGSSRNPGSQNIRRAFGNFVVSGLASLLFRHRMTDVMAGFKAWKAEVTRSISLICDKYSYEVEIPARALQKGYRVRDIPITTEARVAGVSSVRVFRDGMRTIADIIKIRFLS